MSDVNYKHNLYFLLISDLAGTSMVSSSHLGVDGNSSNYTRRKSDSRLDARQIAHLQKVAASASNTSINNMRGDKPSGAIDRNTIQSNYHQAENQQWHQQQNFNANSVRGGTSDCPTEYVDVEYNIRSDLGPFQIIPPQIHRHQRVDCKFLSTIFYWTTSFTNGN